MGFVRLNIQEATISEITLFNGDEIDKIHYADDSCSGSCTGTTVSVLYGDSQDINNATVIYSDSAGNNLATSGYYCFEVLNSINKVYYWDGNTLTLQNC